jgi:hypothetical protein
MNKRPDFGTDLANLNENVSTEVGNVLQALRQQKTESRPVPVPNKEEPIAEPLQATAIGAATSEQPAAPPAPRRPRSASRSRLTPIIERNEPLENVTVKLRRQTNELLTEAALRQQLKKESPLYRQDIVEAALTEWFRKHGYAIGRDNESDH